MILSSVSRGALVALSLVAGACLGCAAPDVSAPIDGPSGAPPTPGPSLPPTGEPAGGSSGPRDDGLVPKLFVRGFGVSFDKLSPKLRSFERYTELLAEEGFPAEHAHDLGNYDDGKTMDEMTAEVATMLSGAMAKYPEGTRFDVMGHSLGGILALRAILDKDLHTKVRTFVALSAPIRGQDSQPLNCTLKIKCTDVYAFYSPFENERVVAYMKANEEKLAAMTLCSEISPDDGVIKAPMEGGQFVGGKNVVLPKVSHLDIIKSPAAVKALKAECFGGRF
jgi:hypothetical protein